MAELYLISPPKVELTAFLPKLKVALATDKIAVFQLRLKDISYEEYKVAAIACQKICQQYNVKFIINDLLQLAKEINSDGLHIGEDDVKYKEARQALGKDKIIGISCYNDLDKAIQMAKLGANHVSFGAFFTTTTKKAKTKADISLIQQYKSQGLKAKLCVIGGIKASNAKPLASQGADYICVISSIWDNNNGVESAIDKLDELLNNN